MDKIEKEIMEKLRDQGKVPYSDQVPKFFSDAGNAAVKKVAAKYVKKGLVTIKDQ